MGRPRDKLISENPFGKTIETLLKQHSFYATDLARASRLSSATLSQMAVGRGLNRENVLKCIEGLVKLNIVTSVRKANDILYQASFNDVIGKYDRPGFEKLDRRNKGDRAVFDLLEKIKAPLEKQQAYEAPTIPYADHEKTLRKPIEYKTLQGIPVIGRDEDIRAIYTKLTEGSIQFLALVGLGGVGKTEIARQVKEEAERGRLFASVKQFDLDVIRTADGIIKLIEDADIPTQGRTLIILDTFEHIQNFSEFFKYFRSHQHITILATSRVALTHDINSDIQILPLEPPLSVTKQLENLKKNFAVQLFVDNAKRHDKTFDLTEENARLIASLCISLDGLPLALLIASSWVGEETLESLHEALLSGEIQEFTSDFNEPERFISLEALFTWSYKQLPEQHQKLFRRLGVFGGQCDVETVYEVCNVDGFIPKIPTLRNWLKNLKNHYLISYNNILVGIIHQTVRTFALRKLEQDDRLHKETIEAKFRDFYDEEIRVYINLKCSSKIPKFADKEDFNAIRDHLLDNIVNLWFAYYDILVIRQTYLAEQTVAYFKQPGEHFLLHLPSDLFDTGEYERKDYDRIREHYLCLEWHFYYGVYNIVSRSEKRGYIAEEDREEVIQLFEEDEAPYPTWVYWQIFFTDVMFELRHEGIYFRINPYAPHLQDFLPSNVL